MINLLSKNQNWAKVTPFLGIATLIWLVTNYGFNDPMFFALINIPLYLFHQTEEHFYPGGFKDYVNYKINLDPVGEETLTDIKIFWINILLVWVAFTLFGVLTYVNIGFGLLIVIFSITNCMTHIVQGIRRKEWNPGLVMSSIQLVISVYAGYFLSKFAIQNDVIWWLGGVAFSVIVHVILFKVVMPNNNTIGNSGKIK